MLSTGATLTREHQGEGGRGDSGQVQGPDDSSDPAHMPCPMFFDASCTVRDAFELTYGGDGIFAANFTARTIG